MAKELICSACGTTGKPKTIVKGSVLIEVVLWLCMLVPGLIYSLWRLSSKRKGCRECGSEHLVPVNSPVGRDLVQKYSANAA